PAVPQYDHRVACLGTGFLQGVEGGKTRAENPCCRFRDEIIGNRNQSCTAGQHHLGVTTIAIGADGRLVLAEFEASATAWHAFVAMAGQATYADALPHFPDRSNTSTQCNDTPHYFVPG